MNDTLTQTVALLGPLVVTATIIAAVIAIAIGRNHRAIATVTGVGLVAALVALIISTIAVPVQVSPLYVVDGYSLFYMGLAVISALVCTVLAFSHFETQRGYRAEFYVLLLCSTLGAMSLVASSHMASLFIGLELLSVPLYGMVAYAYRDRVSLESGLKYMVLSGVASSFLLFGMALLFAASGSLNFVDLAPASAGQGGGIGFMTLGIGMMMVALTFKLSIVPFHLWTPDVYQGAPGPASTFLATVSKLAVFALLIRLFTLSPIANDGWLHALIAVLAFLSMLVGNLLALRQTDLKRLLAYSSIAHIGYILTAVAAGSQLAVWATGVYFAAYVLTTLGAFGVATLVSSPYEGVEASNLRHYRGLYRHQPALAVTLAVMMLSLAGIPMTFGFIGKFYALAVAIGAGLWWLVAALIIGSGIGLYYYMRVLILLFGEPETDTPAQVGRHAGRLATVVLASIAVLVILLGVYPTPLLSLAHAAGMAAAS